MTLTITLDHFEEVQASEDTVPKVPIVYSDVPFLSKRTRRALQRDLVEECLREPSSEFQSDNTTITHPDIAHVEGFFQKRIDSVSSYGIDALTKRLQKVCEKIFGRGAKVFLVPTGTAANVLSMRTLLQQTPQLIGMPSIAHLLREEGGPTMFTNVLAGCSPALLRSDRLGRIRLKDGAPIFQDQHSGLLPGHSGSIAALTISQVNEMGAVYSHELKERIAAWGKDADVPIHVDGARLFYAAAALRMDLGSLVDGVDVFTLSATKVGGEGEAVVFLPTPANQKRFEDPKFVEYFANLQKSFGMKGPKMWKTALHFNVLFEDELWRAIADHSIRMAKFLEEKIRLISGVEIASPVESNCILARMTDKVWERISERYRLFPWTELAQHSGLHNERQHGSLHPVVARIMTSWLIDRKRVDEFVNALEGGTSQEADFIQDESQLVTAVA